MISNIIMKYISTLTLLLTAHCISAHNEDLPDYIKACDIRQDDFQSCIKEQMDTALPKFAKGIPEFNVPSIDPVDIDDIVIDQSNLKISFSDTKMHGLSSVKVTEFKANFDENANFVLGIKGDLSLTAKYVADGRILILPIKGEGDAIINATGVDVNFSTVIKNVTDKENFAHLKLVKPTYKYDIESTTFDLKNLFNGNKQLAETTLKFANENWKQLMDDLAPPAIKQIVTAIIKAINKFFSKVPGEKMIKGFNEVQAIP